MQDDNGTGDQGGDGSDGRESPESAAHYIAAMTAELARIARRNGLDTLGSLLDMAHLEADALANE